MKNTIASSKKINNSEKTIQLNPKMIKTILGITLTVLVLLGLIGQYLRFFTQFDEAWGLIPLVYMARSLSIPTIFQVLLLFLAAALLALIAIVKHNQNDEFRRHWQAMAIMFMFLSLNEASGVYRLVFTPVRNMLRSIFPTVTIYNWSLALYLIAAGLLIFYRKFFLSLPRQFKILFLITAALYITGFTGHKLINGIYLDYYETSNFVYAVLRTTAKSLEIACVISLNYTLLTYLEKNFPKVSLNIEKKAQGN